MSRIGIVSFAFGVPSSILANVRIAEITLQRAKECNAPVYTQLDVFIDPSVLDDVEYTEEKEGNPPPTLRIARGAVRWALEKGLEQLEIVAAEPHLWRCTRDLKMAVYEVRAPLRIRVCKEIEHVPSEEWFYENSSQTRTRSLKAWNARERIVKIMPFWIYKHLAI